MILGRFAASANWGRLPRPVAVIFGRNRIPDGPPTRNPGIPAPFWQNVWDNAQGLVSLSTHKVAFLLHGRSEPRASRGPAFGRVFSAPGIFLPAFGFVILIPWP
jgi:hypothetical protein